MAIAALELNVLVAVECFAALFNDFPTSFAPASLTAGPAALKAYLSVPLLVLLLLIWSRTRGLLDSDNDRPLVGLDFVIGLLILFFVCCTLPVSTTFCPPNHPLQD